MKYGYVIICIALLALACGPEKPAEEPKAPKAESSASPTEKKDQGEFGQPEPSPSEKAAAFKKKVEDKCMAKYPGDKKLRRKACKILLMGAARKACKMAGNGKVEGLCKEHKKYCTPEVKEVVEEGLAFCHALNKVE